MKKIFTIIALFFIINANASHLAGGQIAVRFVGKTAVPNTKVYEIKVTIFRDCLNGQSDYDDPLKVRVFSLGDNSLLQTFDFLLHSRQFISGTGQTACFEIGYYMKQIVINQDFYVTVSRAIRVDNLSNLQSENGLSLYTEVSSEVSGCSITLPKTLSPIVAPTGKTLAINISNMDTLADSSIYEFSRPLLGCHKDEPACLPTAKPYSFTPYNTGYSFTNPVGSTNSMILDRLTGMLTLNFNAIGKYAVGITVTSYKNGLVQYRQVREQLIISCLGCNPLSISKSKIDLAKPLIFPNPANDKINIPQSNNNADEDIAIEIFDINGKLIKNEVLKNSSSIDIHDLSKGIYYLQITKRNNEISRYKFFKL